MPVASMSTPQAKKKHQGKAWPTRTELREQKATAKTRGMFPKALWSDPKIAQDVEARLKAGESVKHIADALNISRTPVTTIKHRMWARERAIAQGMEPAMAAILPKESLSAEPLVQYRRVLNRLLPVRERAELLAALANDESAQVRIKALELIDRLDGISQRVEDQAQAPMPGPMFILPPGADVSVDPPGPNPALDALATAGLPGSPA